MFQKLDITFTKETVRINHVSNLNQLDGPKRKLLPSTRTETEHWSNPFQYENLNSEVRSSIQSYSPKYNLLLVTYSDGRRKTGRKLRRIPEKSIKSTNKEEKKANFKKSKKEQRSQSWLSKYNNKINIKAWT